jgi:dTDP-glucose pyrophosphorylase
MKPTLLIMAAGMGSRFGGLKQVAGVGPGGATLLDYSIYDSLRSGFGKVVFIIRREMEADFRAAVGGRWENKTEVGYAFQELTDLLGGFGVPPGRQKPWGTGQAIYSARRVVREPFAVLNADDYYGRRSFQTMGEYLTRLPGPQSTAYSMVGFQLLKTLSEHGHVSRAVCQADPAGKLQKVVERLKVFKKGTGAEYEDEAGGRHPLTGAELVSMNFWGFTPALMTQLETLWAAFLRERGGEEKSEFLIPKAVDDLITRGQATVQVLPTPDSWFGLTYPEDRERVQAAMENRVAEGLYPENLWA